MHHVKKECRWCLVDSTATKSAALETNERITVGNKPRYRAPTPSLNHLQIHLLFTGERYFASRDDACIDRGRGTGRKVERVRGGREKETIMARKGGNRKERRKV